MLLFLIVTLVGVGLLVYALFQRRSSAGGAALKPASWQTALLVISIVLLLVGFSGFAIGLIKALQNF